MDMNQRVGDYEILGELGRGGMGRVYRVRNVISEREEAMKVVLPDLAGRQDLAARFIREIKVLARLNHPNIAALRTALTSGNQLVMIMELIEGEALSDRLRAGPISVPEALDYVGQALAALGYAHGQTVVHRDIKPANIMVTPQGVVKLTDFGIARARNDQTLTETGSTTGSLSYMSPEQVSGEAVDARSDLYSMGVSLYEMVTGQRPFRADSDFSLMLAQMNEPPRAPIELQPALGPELNGVILKALAKAPAARFQSADEFRQALKNVSATVIHPSRQARVAPLPDAAASPEPAAVITATARAHPARGASLRDQAAPEPASGVLPPVVPPPARSKHPVLYMVLGGMLVVSLLAGTGYYLRRAEGGSPKAGAAAISPPVSPDGAPAAPAASGHPGAAGARHQGPGAVNPPLQAEAPPAPPTAARTDSGAPGQRGAAEGAAPRNPGRPGAGSRGPATGAGAGRAEAPAPLPPAEPVERPTPPTQGGAQPGAAAQQELEQLELELNQLTARAAAANASLDRMQQQQDRQGSSMRGDMAARQQSMNLNLSKMQDALAAGETSRVRRFRDLAASDLGALEQFLGR